MLNNLTFMWFKAKILEDNQDKRSDDDEDYDYKEFATFHHIKTFC